MVKEKTAAELLGEDPAFKDYFQTQNKTTEASVPSITLEVPQTTPAQDETPLTAESQQGSNPLSEFGVAPPGSGEKRGDLRLYKTVAWVVLGIAALIIIYGLFKFLTLLH